MKFDNKCFNHSIFEILFIIIESKALEWTMGIRLERGSVSRLARVKKEERAPERNIVSRTIQL